MVCGLFKTCWHVFETNDEYADLEIALNYGQATGAPQLLRFVTEHTEVHLLRLLKNNTF